MGKSCGNNERPNQHHLRYYAEKLITAIDNMQQGTVCLNNGDPLDALPGKVYIGGVERQKMTRAQAKQKTIEIIRNKFEKKYPFSK